MHTWSLPVLISEGEEELQDEEEAEDYDPLSMDATSPDDSLTPLEKLDKYFQDEDISKRFAMYPKTHSRVLVCSYCNRCMSV